VDVFDARGEDATGLGDMDATVIVVAPREVRIDSRGVDPPHGLGPRASGIIRGDEEVAAAVKYVVIAGSVPPTLPGTAIAGHGDGVALF
jgi:hypothetical protein